MSNDTIAAIATAAGVGGVGIVRLSGPAAIAIAADALGIAVDALDRRVRVGWVRDPAGRALDQVLALAMRAPGSFTGEDVAELHATMGRSPSSAAGARAIRSTRDSCAPDRTGESQRPGENGVPGETTNCSL